jgi:hypothetical protein
VLLIRKSPVNAPHRNTVEMSLVVPLCFRKAMCPLLIC